jgi:HEAT repeat protein
MTSRKKLSLLALAVSALGATGFGLWSTVRPVARSAVPMLQAPGRAPAPAAKPAERSVTVADLESSFRAAPDATSRVAALRRASELPEPAAVLWLASVAGSDVDLAAQAAAALGAVAQKSAAAELLRLATGTAPVLVRANAVRALGRSGTPREAAVLAILVRDPIQPQRVRQEGLLALATLGDGAMTPVLIATLDDLARDATPNGQQLRLTALTALSQLGTREATNFLADYAKRTRSETERVFALRGVAKGG